jgi:hypothetical protein
MVTTISSKAMDGHNLRTLHSRCPQIVDHGASEMVVACATIPN